MKKWKVSIVMVLLTVLVLGACKNIDEYEDDETVEVSNPVVNEDQELELILRHLYSPEDSGGNQARREMFDIIEEKTGVKVTLDEGTRDGYEAILSNEANRNELPHIIEMYTTQHGTFFYEDYEHLLDLTDFLKDSGLMEQFHTLADFTIDDRVYGLPERGSTVQLFYNKELIEKLGGVPESWEDLIETMEAASRAGYNPLLLDDVGFSAFSLLEGVLQQTVSNEKLLDLMSGDAKWTDAEFVATFELLEALKPLNISQVNGNPLELIQAFLSEDTVFAYSNDWLLGVLSMDEYAHMQGNIGMISLPTVAGGLVEQSSVHGSFPFGYVFRGNVTEEEERMIYQFIEALWSEEMMFDQYAQYGHLPAIRVETTTDNELFQEIINTTNEAERVFPGIKEFISYAGKNSYDPFLYESETSKILNRFIFENRSTEETLEAMQSYHERVLKEANLIE
ncbi:ABC transporter substrate-binding protein [Bacillus alkalicellulosilyticus]|uniref:ABC transporter substrate-binding protein n=1 Tax=Alkalihalobacterium alkalicellulosilyticum TaxID=1912214 RepID=UPI0009960D7B|nr:ABC transporter substrate-binding protein [Bacillus alkalicellulosilyticus]